MSSRRSQLVLLGLGHGHLQVLRDWSQRLHKGVDLTVVTPASRFVYSGGLTRWVSGACSEADISVDIAPWIRASGAKWIQDRCIALDANARTITMRSDPHAPLHYDWLSINTGSSMGLQQLEDQIPGARGRVLPIRPVEQFMDYWKRALDTAVQRPMSVSVIGAGAGGVELALAIKHHLKQLHARASVTLLAGREDWLAPPDSSLRLAAERALARAQVQVLTPRCKQIKDGELWLDNGMRLACDLPIVTTGSLAPPWLQDSGLNLDAHGYVAVNAHQQSTSHLRVFALGDVATRVDRPLPKNAGYALHAGQAHAQTLWAAIQGMALKPVFAQGPRVQLMDTADGRAIATWKGISTSGRWVKWWKHSRDQKALSPLRAPN